MNKFFVVEDREKDTVRIVENEDSLIGSEIDLTETKTMEEAKAFAIEYQQKRITALIGNMFDLGEAPSFYFVTTMMIEDPDDDSDTVGMKYRNVCKQGFFTTEERAKKFLNDNWYMLHEFHNNYGVVEKVKMGVADHACWNVEQWWYKDKTALESKLSEELEPTDRPKCTEINEGSATMFAF